MYNYIPVLVEVIEPMKMAEMAMAIAIMAIISNTKLVLIEIFFTDDLKFACSILLFMLQQKLV